MERVRDEDKELATPEGMGVGGLVRNRDWRLRVREELERKRAQRAKLDGDIEALERSLAILDSVS